MPRDSTPANPPFTAPATPTFSTFGDIARPWPEIVRFYEELAAGNGAFANLAELARSLGSSGFPAAGLCGLTSMHDLLLGPSAAVLDNPHLHIGYDFETKHFMFEYRDGSRTPWTRTASPSEVFAALERFLIRRARWFRASAG